MLIEKLKVGQSELINVPADEKTLLDLGVSKMDIVALIADAKKAQFTTQCQSARSYAYHTSSDGLAFDYLAAAAEFGESSEQASHAKQAWLQARHSIKALYPKPE
ncbi:hypothetical protein [Pseudoalteromonas xiamenensis]|uniref:Uncharacterized protein n=1 Tax=Pseudoalteromonas xiamenensis TaxID=882626 RepID=A0A975HKF6_9GAMM|nr:hypothetical protein [Pseudoalteromonas xiamenensis]QTH70929.1 hypothetical protein J5O05_13750 [Pseudoalteromonas xiamenensis]